MEIVKDKHPYCPQCGRKRGVTLRRIKYEANVFRRLNEEDKVVYFICCKNCRIRFKIINFGIWDE